MSAAIDPPARRALARLLRRFAAGQMTNREFEAGIPRSRDAAIAEITSLGIWPLYDDLSTHKMTGRWRLTPPQRKAVARIVLYLHAGLPYRYPRESGWAAARTLLLSALTAGWFGRQRRAQLWREADTAAWPFVSRRELDAARQVPLFLNARRAS